ncbi:endolytic transglycosylase MltG [Alkalihalobacillus pseudalcaliphilus]|uniref:endolytic transglycosylase MltG n=1 Tax=Alkalihalobacillus pseudalcaliphilus TaxID=79884 RepID=UPI00064DBC6F|nr:endolytic transglycosylase MltG [Alkalihalobacillus pseudalcaliphilus]KMK75748.1 aminodeoxychorismate lyase [Alkalihalobacillus pseudalcaliphilus]
MAKSNNKHKNELFEERVAQAKIVRKIVFVTVIILLIAAGIVGLIGYNYITSALKPMDAENPEVVEVEIPLGSGSSTIGTILEENGLIQNSTFFRYYVRYKNESGFQAGTYQLSTGMTMDDMIEELKEGSVMADYALSFTIPEGRWLVNVVDTIAEETDYETDEIFSVIEDDDYLNELIDRYDMLTDEILQEDIRYALEGYLFPARYDFLEEQPEVSTIIEEMLNRTQAIYDRLAGEVEASDYTFHELLTLASIIEREAQQSEDRYKISGVLYNRLDTNMRLQVDPTVAYAIGEHLYITTFDDLEYDSPYNTYRYEGIPIGPIAAPGEDAIIASLRPDDVEHLYFFARVNGEVIYTDTFEEHREVANQYRQEWYDFQNEVDESDE